jgi:hypothetical protein
MHILAMLRVPRAELKPEGSLVNRKELRNDFREPRLTRYVFAWRTEMAYRPNDPNDPFIRPLGDTPPPMTDPALEPNRYEEESGISGTRIALYAVAVLAIVGALFYGMSATTTTDRAGNPPASNMAAERPATPPPAVRDVTPRSNTAPGMTTGSAPAQTPPGTQAEPAPANPAGSAQ